MDTRAVCPAKRFIMLEMALTLMLALAIPAHAATYDYAVDGGNLVFDPSTGTITACDDGVYNADIPSEIYGVPVRVIGKDAFWRKSKLASVTIPSSVTRIEAGAFYHCTNLVTITIPNSVTELGDKNNYYGVFEECNKLETITIPGSIDTLNAYLFKFCANLRSVTLGEGIKKIDGSVFSNCDKLKEITLPDSVTSIASFAFDGCDILDTVTVGQNTAYIDGKAFNNCPELTAIYFRGDAPAASDNMVTKFANGFFIYYPQSASGWTAPTWNGYITKPYNPSGTTSASTTPTTPATPAPPATPATPSRPVASGNMAYARMQLIDLDGKTMVLPTYALKDSNGNETNFVKLRDIAYIMNGTVAKFNVGWDGAVNITPRRDYTPDGSELRTPFTGDRVYRDNTAATKIDGVTVSLRAIVLTDDNGGGYTYYKLRDLGEALGFNVGWSSTRGIYIESNKPYTG